MFTDFAMELLQLLLQNTIDGFRTAQSRIEECLPGFSTHCVRVVHFLMLKFHLVKVNNMWLKSKTFFSWYSVVLVLVHEEFPCVLVFHRQEYGGGGEVEV
jgi:hypothetical protein